MQFALEKCSLAPCENEIRLFASTYRRTEGQVNFLAGNGLLKGPFVEMTGIVVGFNSWALGRFRTSGVASRDTGETVISKIGLTTNLGKTALLVPGWWKCAGLIAYRRCFMTRCERPSSNIQPPAIRTSLSTLAPTMVTNIGRSCILL